MLGRRDVGKIEVYENKKDNKNMKDGSVIYEDGKKEDKIEG